MSASFIRLAVTVALAATSDLASTVHKPEIIIMGLLRVEAVKLNGQMMGPAPDAYEVHLHQIELQEEEMRHAVDREVNRIMQLKSSDESFQLQLTERVDAIVSGITSAKSGSKVSLSDSVVLSLQLKSAIRTVITKGEGIRVLASQLAAFSGNISRRTLKEVLINKIKTYRDEILQMVATNQESERRRALIEDTANMWIRGLNLWQDSWSIILNTEIPIMVGEMNWKFSETIVSQL